MNHNYKRTPKYMNKKCKHDDYTFDSIKELNRYIFLKRQQEMGIIKDLEVAPRFRFEGAIIKGAKVCRTATYKADFSYTDATGKKIVEDVKSAYTAELYEFKFKRAIFERDFKQEITVII